LACLTPRIEQEQFAGFVGIFISVWKFNEVAEIKATSRSQEKFVSSLSRIAKINPQVFWY
jgi:hypothetical protein